MMKSSFRLAGAAALCAALLVTACAKKTDQTTTSTDTSSTSATASSSPSGVYSAVPGASPAADSSAASATSPAPDASATAVAANTTSAPSADATTAVTASTSNGTAGAGGGYIDLPVYPGATETKEGAMSMSTNTGSLVVKIYTTHDDTKKVADWYKGHLPAAFKGGVMTAGGNTVGTFADEHTDGDQSVIVASKDDHTTHIQLTTKHGK
ncbi:MAG: hypothetical protein JWM87_583 [Candidatus Eremiobacteraeota bacterium]|nr:hypothetical protein [Candidatus Eremiobacteraeota bacterium]